MKRKKERNCYLFCIHVNRICLKIIWRIKNMFIWDEMKCAFVEIAQLFPFFPFSNILSGMSTSCTLSRFNPNPIVVCRVSHHDAIMKHIMTHTISSQNNKTSQWEKSQHSYIISDTFYFSISWNSIWIPIYSVHFKWWTGIFISSSFIISLKFCNL